jgi:hypothetical protein
MKRIILPSLGMAFIFGCAGALWGAAFPRGPDRLTWICFYAYGFGIAGFIYGGLITSVVVLVSDFARYREKKARERELQ